MINTKKLTVSALYMAIFIVILGVTSGVSFGAIQVRVVNALYAVPYLIPYLVLPTGLAVVLSNLLFGGLGLTDIVGGFFVAILTTSSIVYLKRKRAPKWTITLPILTIPALLVPSWLSPIIGVPYWTLVMSIALGHIIPALLGLILVKALENKI